MSKELVIGSNRHETKVAVLEEDQLVEVYFQRGNEYSLAGSIHKGRVTRVLPGMQSAFVDLGLERDTFLYVSDFFEENDDIDTVTDEKPLPRGDRRDRDRGRPVEARPAPILEILEPASEAYSPGLEVEAEEEAEETGDAPEETIPISAGSRLPTPDAVRAESRGEVDRGLRGDKRGRRSRRRRTRGHGFPDNKYAQPGQGDARVETRADVEAVPRYAVMAESVTEAETDVIILPGESLAKYRRLPPVIQEEPNREEFSENEDLPEISTVPAEEAHEAAAEIAAEHEALTAEAEEIELADRILSHRGADVFEEEEVLAEVRHEEHQSPFIVSDIEMADIAEEEQPAIIAEFLVVETPVERSEALIIETPVSRAVDTYEGLSAGERAEDELAEDAEEAEVEFAGTGGTEEFPNEPDGHADESTIALGDMAMEGLSADPGVESPSGLGSDPAGTQSASVREQSDRYMHRVGGRRMRRRRGGRGGQQNFGQRSGAPQGQDTAIETGTPVPEARGVSGTGTVLAVERRPEPNQELRREVPEERSAERPERAMPSISELLKPGQEIIVQIAKEPLGQKGARITSHIALPGRYVVFMPSVTHLGVSRKIASDEERQRLKRILQTYREGTTGGFIVRTAGEGVPEDEIAADMDFLYKLWLDIRQKAEKRPAPLLLHCDLDVVQRILRDQVTEEFKAIWVDHETLYENVLSFMQRFQPALVNRVKMYTRSAPIFDAFGITPELEKALRPKVWLKSGGYIVINQTEALVAIDINTGKYVGKSNRLEDTIVKTNIEAVKEIVRQIRLRDLGGIIVVDFIDMDERKNRQKVMQALEEAMRVDKAPYKILQFNDFGLVAITRKRVKQSLERALCSPCPYCEGAGYVKSVQTVIGEILVEAQKLAKAIEGKDVLLRVHPDVAKVLKGNDNRFLEEIEEILQRPVLVKGDPTLHTEKFDLG